MCFFGGASNYSNGWFPPGFEWRYDCLRTFRDRCLGRRKRIRRSKKNPGAGDKVTMFFTSSMCFFVGFSKSTGLSWGFSYSQISQMLDLPGRWQKSCSANSRNLVFVDSLLKEIMVKIGSSESSFPWNKCQETSNFGYVWDDSPYHSFSSSSSSSSSHIWANFNNSLTWNKVIWG